MEKNVKPIAPVRKSLRKSKPKVLPTATSVLDSSKKAHNTKRKVTAVSKISKNTIRKAKLTTLPKPSSKKCKPKAIIESPDAAEEPPQAATLTGKLTGILLPGKKLKKNKKVKFHFTIDCSDVDLDIPGLGIFLLQKMKVFRKSKALKMKLIVTSETLFKKSSLKYWTKAYLTENLQRPVEVTVTSKRSYKLKYLPLE